MLYERAIGHKLTDELLPSHASVMLVGPRSIGKTTILSSLAKSVLDLSIPSQKEAAASDPDLILARLEKPVLIDEWQELPEILWAVKRAIDRDLTNKPGQYMIAGSAEANVHTLSYPLSGRTARTKLYGLSQAELENNSNYNIVDTLFTALSTSSFPSYQEGKKDLIKRIDKGKFPAFVNLSAQARDQRIHAYIEHAVQRDAALLSDKTPRPELFKSFLKVVASFTGDQPTKKMLADRTNISVPTVDLYLETLQKLCFVATLKGWRSNVTKRELDNKKIHIVDTSLVCTLLNLSEDSLITYDKLGHLTETFVIAEFLTHLQTCEAQAQLFHFRTKDQIEVDLVIETSEGSVAAVEVKAGKNVSDKDAKGLRHLKSKLQEKFHCGIILSTAEHPRQIEEKIWVVPMSYLWEG